MTGKTQSGVLPEAKTWWMISNIEAPQAGLHNLRLGNRAFPKTIKSWVTGSSFLCTKERSWESKKVDLEWGRGWGVTCVQAPGIESVWTWQPHSIRAPPESSGTKVTQFQPWTVTSETYFSKITIQMPMRFIRRCLLITTEHKKKNPRPDYKNSYYWKDRKEHSLQRYGNHRYPKLMVGGKKKWYSCPRTFQWASLRICWSAGETVQWVKRLLCRHEDWSSANLHFTGQQTSWTSELGGGHTQVGPRASLANYSHLNSKVQT